MTQRDEDSFLAAMQAEADVVVSLNYFSKADLEALCELPPAGPKIGINTDLSIYNRDIGPKLIVRKSFPGERYSLDVTRSEVVQFNRCFIASDGKLEPGRLWYDHETMQCKPKRKVFLSWAQAVLKFIKKNYRHSENRFRYIGPDALTQFETHRLAPAP